MLNTYTEKFVVVNGVRVHYQEWGESSSPDVLLVHGWSTSAPIWHEIACELSSDYHVIVPDNRGNGESQVQEHGYRLSDYATDLAKLILEIQLDRPALVGSSWGGNIGTYMAVEYAELVSKVILADPVYWKMIDAFKTIIPSIISRLKDSEETVRLKALQNGADHQKAEREVYINYHFSPIVLKHIAIQNRDWSLDSENFLADLSVPTLLLIADPKVGGYISEFEFEHIREIASANVELRLWKGVGHLMHAEDPNRFLREVRDFLLPPAGT
tara:strand:+ start:2213 stop:3025 length:813 start_codon:yes stop_codon:yes gene_type:complete